MKPSQFFARIFFALGCVTSLLFSTNLSAKEPLVEVGVAKIDITPDYPIRLCGYAVRKKESEGIAQHLWAKALAIGSDKDRPAILITVDNTGVPASVRNEVAQRLLKKGITSERFALCSSHSHTTPCLAGNLPTLFGEPLPPEHQAHIDRYTRDLIDALEKVALEALKNRRPGKLSWGQTSAAFAANRRTKGGPVDHDLPVLVVTDSKDKLRAILVNYACHCTTLGGETNWICGDWAGYAQECLQRDHPGAITMVAIGCGGDANPQPRGNLDFAKQHGAEIESAVNQLLDHSLTPIRGKLECRAESIELPFDTLPTRAEWEQKALQTNYVGYHARVNLAKLDRGEQLPTKLPYMVQSWSFGNDLAMVFLSGEVVVDYSLRLKKEFDSARLWITAYANDVPCYIPSERILKEGGYEGGGAMIYYDKPTRLAPGIENHIVNAVHELVPKEFLFDEKRAEFPPPKSPEESLAAMQTKAGFEIQLAAAEPLIVDPVAIDWGADGKLWVVEMRDYPMGMDNKWKPGSRVKFLEDTNHDGKYDKATVFVDNLPFATGVMAWRKGVLICAAPDILYAEEVGNGRERHVVVKKLFTGFVTENYQARVNSLSLGLDNWIYGANGLLGGTIHGTSQGLSPLSGGSAGRAATGGAEVDIRGRDFRMNPDSGAFEPASGLTQQGRVRDDWGNWFGCDNSTIAWHYPLPDHYIRRNPYVTAPSPRVSIAAGDNPNLLHPISRTLERFNQPQSANHVTSGCGLCIYRDDLLGDELYGNAFLCEPVHNLVHRLVLEPNGLTFSGVRAADEQQSEFLASRDNWFRPVQARTGPDGALWVVDMYRFVIEHPRWIPPERLAKLDIRAGEDKGRIYRIVPKGKKLRPIRDLTKLSTAQLAAALDTPNGTERDRIYQELAFPRTQRPRDQSAIRDLENLAIDSNLPAVRLQALCALDGLDTLNPESAIRALSDHSADVRANAIRLSEKLASTTALESALAELANDPDIHVRFQLALTLGEWKEPFASKILGKLAARDTADPWMRAAILSSATRGPAEVLRAVLALDSNQPGRTEMIRQLIATAAGAGDSTSLLKVVEVITPTDSEHLESWQLGALRSLLDALDRKNLSLASLAGASVDTRTAAARISLLFDWSRQLAAAPETKDSLREPALHLLGRDPMHQKDDLKLLAELLERPLAARSQAAVFDSLKRIRSPEVPQVLLANWKQRPPSLRQSSIEVLLSRDEWLSALLDNIENGTVGSNEISPANRQRLLKHANSAIQRRALALWKAAGGSRAEVLAKYQTATTLSGDASKGATVFANTCATCHFLRGQGHAVGPNLAALADKTPADFLTAILDPNAVVEPRFVAYNIEIKDGRSLTGVVSAETATTLTLVQGGGAQETVLRGDIQEMRASGLSLMPEGLEQNLAPQDLANLIAYLKTSPRAFGSASAEQAEEARKKFLAAGCNGLGKIIGAADRLPYPSWLGTLAMPYCRQTQEQSKLAWETLPVPADLKSDSTYQFRLAAGMGFASQPSGKFELRLNEKPVLEFNVSLTDRSWQSADAKVKMSYTVMENNAEDSNGVLLIEVAGSLLTPGKAATFEVIGSPSNSQRWFGVYALSAAAPQASR